MIGIEKAILSAVKDEIREIEIKAYKRGYMTAYMKSPKYQKYLKNRSKTFKTQKWYFRQLKKSKAKTAKKNYMREYMRTYRKS